MDIEKIAYHGWENCYRLSNPSVDLIALADVGPRLIRFGFLGEENQFDEVSANFGKTGGEAWRPYGGHRFWHAPEAFPRTYAPDNHPVEVQVGENTLYLVQPVETATGIQKELQVSLDLHEPRATISHRLRNTNLWEVELAPWALTLMALGGTAILPLPTRRSHEGNLLPSNTLTMWFYTDLSDPRWVWGKNVILLRQDPQNKEPQKIGAQNPAGWLAYVRDGFMFVKFFAFHPGMRYPDMGSSAEIFTRHDILELESLAPLTRLEPGAVVEHVEHWRLFKNVPDPIDNNQVVDQIIPLIQG